MIKKIINYIMRFFNGEESIFFVGSADKLPEPLSKEDEVYYVTLLVISPMLYSRSPELYFA